MTEIDGLTYLSSDRLYAVSNFGGAAFLECDPTSACTTPIPVGALHDSDYRVYVGNSDGTVSVFSGESTHPTNTFPIAPGQFITQSLARAAGVLYVGTGSTAPGGTNWASGSLSAADDTTGAILWARDTTSLVDWPASIVFAGNSPTHIIFITEDYTLSALAPATGQELWSVKAAGFSQYVHGQTVYHPDMSDSSLCARSVADGSLIWEYKNPPNENIIGITVAGGVVYATTFGAQVVALDAQTGELVWETKIAPPYPGIPTTHFEPALELVIFVVGQEGIGPCYAQALDAGSGAVVWNSTVPLSSGNGGSCTPPIVAGWIGDSMPGRMVQVGTADGRLVSLDVRTGELLWDVQLTNSPLGFSTRPRWAPT